MTSKIINKKSMLALMTAAILATSMSGLSFASEVAYTEALNTVEMFTDRDKEQSPDLSDAETITVSDGEDINITAEGVYVLSGSASDVTINVEAASVDKVQLVLDGLSITNSNTPAISITNGDKVFVTTTADSTLIVTDKFSTDNNSKADAVIYSKSDLVLNGSAALTIESSDHGVITKDSMKITGGTYNITAENEALKANDDIRILDGAFNITAGDTAIKSKNDNDDSKGFIYIAGGTFELNAVESGIHALSVVQIDGGDIHVASKDCIEGTYVQINGGTILLEGTGDGIHAYSKSKAFASKLEINGGELTVQMTTGDTEGFDAKGDVEINGGIVTFTGNVAFDYKGSAALNGGTLSINGKEVSSIPNKVTE